MHNLQSKKLKIQLIKDKSKIIKTNKIAITI